MPKLLLFPVLALMLLVGGCSDPSIIPFAGYWDGQFKVQPADPGVKMRPEWVYKGYLQVYATNRNFKMHMESIAQIVDISGKWTNKGNKLYLKADKVEFDDKGGKVVRPNGVNPIDPDAVRAAYSQEMVYEMSSDKKYLTSLDMSMGPVIGKHVFKKGGE